MELREGDQVLLLLPDSMNKFWVKWLYNFKKKLGKVIYKITMPEQWSSKVVHMNLLKKRQQMETAYANVIDEDLEIVDYCWIEVGDYLWVGEQLGTEQSN